MENLSTLAADAVALSAPGELSSDLYHVLACDIMFFFIMLSITTNGL